MLFVRDVPASSRWYQDVFGARSGHGGDEYEMIEDDQGTLLFQLHHLEGDEHAVGALGEGDPRGGGVLVYVQVDDVQAVHRRATELGADVLSAPAYIDLATHTEFILRDRDGYTLAVMTPGNHA